jgi:hypothetical protein
MLVAEEQPPARSASLPATGGSAELAVDEQPPAQFTVEPLPEFIHHRQISSVHMAAHVAFCLRICFYKTHLLQVLGFCFE